MEKQVLIWKNIFTDHPKSNCKICLRVGDDYETFTFKAYGMDGENWELRKYPKIIMPNKVPSNAEYIILDNK